MVAYVFWHWPTPRSGEEELTKDAMLRPPDAAASWANSANEPNRANWNQLHHQMVAQALISEAELASDLERLDDPAFMSFAQTMWSAWGRKPAS
jgi:hypothetical protein